MGFLCKIQVSRFGIWIRIWDLLFGNFHSKKMVSVFKVLDMVCFQTFFLCVCVCLKSLLQLQDMTHCFFKIYGSWGIHIFCSGRTVQFRFWFRLETFSARLRNLCQIFKTPRQNDDDCHKRAKKLPKTLFYI